MTKFKKIFPYSILVLGISTIGCTNVEEFNVSSKNIGKSNSIITSSCNTKCRKYVSNKLNIEKIRYRSSVVEKTQLKSVDGVYDRYTAAWHRNYKIEISPGKHKLTARPKYCFSFSKEQEFTFDATVNHTYFVGDAVLEVGRKKDESMVYAWTPIVYDISSQTLIYPTDTNKWKNNVQVGGTVCRRIS